MRYHTLGTSGLRVSECALGAMTFGTAWGFGTDAATSRAIFAHYDGAGGNFIDTAVNYQDGQSEEIVGDCIAGDRERFVVATKYTLSTRREDPNACGNHRKNLVRSVETSLRRMKTEHIDLLWMHAWDQRTPEEEVVRALDDLVRSGKVLYVGISDTPAWVVSRMVTLADLRGWSRFIGLQVEYSLVERGVERELLPMAKALGIGVTAWGALAGGLLTGKYQGTGTPDTRRTSAIGRLNDRTRPIVDAVVAVATELDCAPTHVAHAWLRSKGVMPILGARTVAQLDQTLFYRRVHPDAAQLARLDAASAIDLGWPHTFLSRPDIQRIIHGDHPTEPC